MWSYNYIDELYHHGVKGQKWGVRHYQNSDGSLTSAGEKRYSKSSKQIEENKEDPSKKKGLTGKQKAIIIGASIVAAYATYKFIDSGNATRLIEKGKSVLGKDISFKKNPELSSKNLSEDEILSKVVGRINPDYGKPGTVQNCKRCTYAYEMSRRGFDVKATKSMTATGQHDLGGFNATHKEQTNILKERLFARFGKDTNYSLEIRNNRATSKVFDKAKNGLFSNTEKFKKAKESASKIDELSVDKLGQTVTKKSNNYAKDIFKSISKHPNGARGELTVSYRIKGLNMDVGRHSMAWEMVNNHPVVFDCQTGKKYNIESFSKDFGELLHGASINRLDNKELNEDFLRRWITNA